MLHAVEPTEVLSGPRPTAERSAINNISESISMEIRRHKVGAVLALLAVLLIVGAGSFGLQVAQSLQRRWTISRTSDSRLTNSGNVIDATIS